MATKAGNIKIDPELLRSISKKAKDENTTENNILNQMIKRLERSKNETLVDKLKRLTNGKITVVNQDKYIHDPKKMRN